MSTVDCARSPYGESTFKRNRPSFAVLMVLGGGGGFLQLFCMAMAWCSGSLKSAKKQKSHLDFDVERLAASKDTLFFDFRGRLVSRCCSSSLVLFSSAIYSCQGDLATCFTCLQMSKASQKSPCVVRTLAFKHARSLMSCSTRQPASPASCM